MFPVDHSSATSISSKLSADLIIMICKLTAGEIIESLRLRTFISLVPHILDGILHENQLTDMRVILGI
jgi:hypothetical protein